MLGFKQAVFYLCSRTVSDQLCMARREYRTAKNFGMCSGAVRTAVLFTVAVWQQVLSETSSVFWSWFNTKYSREKMIFLLAFWGIRWLFIANIGQTKYHFFIFWQWCTYRHLRVNHSKQSHHKMLPCYTKLLTEFILLFLNFYYS